MKRAALLALKKCKFRISGIVIGSLGGIPGLITGFLAGFFADKLSIRKKADMDLVRAVENPSCTCSKFPEEPFAGALLVCALAVRETGNAAMAARHMSLCFNDAYPGSDWLLLCSAAFKADVLNTDLAAECLAVILKKKNDIHLTADICRLLDGAAYGWDDDIGIRPGEYLSSLLNVRTVSDETASACFLLGVRPEDELPAVKNAYRQLVSLYHPDTLKYLSEEQKKIASDAFIRIQKAYKHILKERAV